MAREATGVYWLPGYGVLEAAGRRGKMVNGKPTRTLPGRKTDLSDAPGGRRCPRTGGCGGKDLRALPAWARHRVWPLVGETG